MHRALDRAALPSNFLARVCSGPEGAWRASAPAILYLANTTIATVNSPMVVSSTLWPQRAIRPSMVKSPQKKLNDATWCMAAISLHCYEPRTCTLVPEAVDGAALKNPIQFSLFRVT